MTKKTTIISLITLLVVLLIGVGVFSLTTSNSDTERVEDNTTTIVDTSVETNVEQELPKPPISPESPVVETISADTPQTTVDQEETTYKTYTNEFFPDFELVYPRDWKFETSTVPYQDTNLLIRSISLEEGNLGTLSITITPSLVPQGCGGDILVYEKTYELWEGFYEFKKTTDNSVFREYGNNPLCAFDEQITSNINTQDVVNDPFSFWEDENVVFILDIRSRVYSENESVFLDQVRDILIRSRFE